MNEKLVLIGKSWKRAYKLCGLLGCNTICKYTKIIERVLTLMYSSTTYSSSSSSSTLFYLHVLYCVSVLYLIS